MRRALRFAALALLACAAPAAAQPRVLDAMDDARAWTALPSDGVSLTLASDAGRRGRALRMDVDFHGGGGYAVARRALPIDFPENYELAFWIRGTVPPNNLEVKLVDASGDNVWWVNRRDFVFSEGWTQVRLRKRHVSFAWGPLGGGELRRAAAVEFAVTAGSGGRGSVWIDELTLETREPILPYDGVPSATATSGDASGAFDASPRTRWRSAAAGEQGLDVDFGRPRELGGLVLSWDPAARATRYTVLGSADGVRWDTLRTVAGAAGPRDYLRLPETEARHLRFRFHGGNGARYDLDAAVQPLAFGEPNEMFRAAAADAPAGVYPRGYREQAYWTVLGVDGDSVEALISEDGAVEVGKGSFSLEPFLFADGALRGWAGGRTTHTLAEGDLPIPSVRREHDGLALTVTAFASGAPGASVLWTRYRVANTAAAPREATLLVALRPFQVNPPTQFLNTAGGFAPLRTIAWNGRGATVNGDRTVVPLTAPAAFGAETFAAGGLVPSLLRGAVPATTVATDTADRAASGAFAYPLSLAAGDSAEVWFAVPLYPNAPAPAADEAAALAALAAATAEWRGKLHRAEIELPASAERIAASIRANLAYVLVNRDGPAIQPGSRSYERSWIRDGSLTSAALLKLGHHDTVRDFLLWYAPFQYANGKVPCCVDRRGADPVPEHDSHGQLVYLIAEHFRHTGDTALVRTLWPRVQGAVAYLDTLRQQRRTPVYRTDSLAYFGMLPQSISHEGYSAKPMHSYWDGFFGLRGLKDAAWLADVLGAPEAPSWAAMRDEFRADLLASFDRAMAMHGIDFLPGAVELGDFDATSTTVGVTPGGERDGLPRAALERTFARYWEEFEARRDGRRAWDAYTPYEWRVVGTMVRLGWKDRAHALIDWFFEHQRPAGWGAWAEVVGRDPREPRFIGDTPHTWVGSDFIRSALDLLAYEDDDGALVLAHGVPAAWMASGEAVAVTNLSTHFGPLTYRLTADGTTVRITFASNDARPPNGYVIHTPLDLPLREARVDGRRVRPSGPGVVRVPAGTREVVLLHDRR